MTDPIQLYIYLSLVIILMILYALFSINFLIEYKKQTKMENRDEKAFVILTLSFDFIFLIIGRIVLVYFDISNDFDFMQYGRVDLILWKIGIIMQLLGFGFFFILIEKRFMKGGDKHYHLR